MVGLRNRAVRSSKDGRLADRARPAGASVEITTNYWPSIELNVPLVLAEVGQAESGSYAVVEAPLRPKIRKPKGNREGP